MPCVTDLKLPVGKPDDPPVSDPGLGLGTTVGGKLVSVGIDSAGLGSELDCKGEVVDGTVVAEVHVDVDGVDAPLKPLSVVRPYVMIRLVRFSSYPEPMARGVAAELTDGVVEVLYNQLKPLRIPLLLWTLPGLSSFFYLSTS